MAFCKFTMGRFIASHFRDMLKSLQFKGYKVDYLETGGWFEKDFRIHASVMVINSLRIWVDEYNREEGY